MKAGLLFCILSFCLPKYLAAQTSKYIHVEKEDTTYKIFENPNPPKSFTYDYNYGLAYIANLKNGFMDSFSIANAKFRYRLSPDTSENCIVEKFENGRWKKNFKTDYTSYEDSFLCDVNNDGYKDFVEAYKWYDNAILFNPSTKEFDTSSLFGLNEWTLLDSLQNIFCDYEEVHDHQESSHLYKFDGLKQKILFAVKFTSKEMLHEDLPVITKIDLYKGDFEDGKNSKLISSTKIHNRKYEFHYVAYWKKRYKELLNSH